MQLYTCLDCPPILKYMLLYYCKSESLSFPLNHPRLLVSILILHSCKWLSCHRRQIQSWFHLQMIYFYKVHKNDFDHIGLVFQWCSYRNRGKDHNFSEWWKRESCFIRTIDKLHLGFLVFLKGSNNQIIERGEGKDHYVRLDLLSIMSDVPCKAINPSWLKKEFPIFYQNQTNLQVLL